MWLKKTGMDRGQGSPVGPGYGSRPYIIIQICPFHDLIE